MPQRVFKFEGNLCSIPSGVYADCRHVMNWLYDKLEVNKNAFGSPRISIVRYCFCSNSVPDTMTRIL